MAEFCFGRGVKPLAMAVSEGCSLESVEDLVSQGNDVDSSELVRQKRKDKKLCKFILLSYNAFASNVLSSSLFMNLYFPLN